MDFFSDRILPAGPQHANEYSVFINLAEVVRIQLDHLHGDVETSCQSATRLLIEVKAWLEKQAVTIPEVVEAD